MEGANIDEHRCQRRPVMANTFHVAVYVQRIPEAVEKYRKILGVEPAKVRHDYAKFELHDPPVVFSLNVGGEPGTLSHLGVRYPTSGEVASEMVRVKQTDTPLFQQEGTTCCYAKADKFWVRDADGIAWEMYTLLEDVEAETASDRQLRAFLGQGAAEPEASVAGGCGTASSQCCVPEELVDIDGRR
jgi:catechol 2,3-dioxygenase-like lactoylglutathione lyase family enzyme